MYLLDASALLAVLLNEPGAAFVLSNMQHGEISIVNVAEVLAKSVEQGGDAERTMAVLHSYGLRIRAFRDVHAIAAAKLRPLTKHLGLSFGDRACLVQAHFSGLPVLTGDRKRADLDLGIDIRLIR